MQFEVVGKNKDIVYINVSRESIIINDVESALDLMATVGYEVSCEKIIIDKKNICDGFFDLKTGIAGEILQKFSNYGVKFAIIGEFANIDSKALRDFIFECNNGSSIFFIKSLEDAIEKLDNICK